MVAVADAVAVDAYFHRYRQTIAIGDSGDVTADLAAEMRELITTFSTPAGAVMAQLISQAQLDAELAATLRQRWVQPRRAVTEAVLRRGIARGQVRPDCDLAAVMDALYGPLYYRLTVRHEPLEPELADTLVRVVLDGIRPPARPGGPPPSGGTA